MTGVLAATFGALGRRFQKRKRRARAELAELASGVEEIVRWQRGLAVLVLLALYMSGQRFVVASDPVRGNLALLEAPAARARPVRRVRQRLGSRGPPRSPHAFLERFRHERNAERALADEPELLPASWFATDDGSSFRPARIYQFRNDPDVPDRELSAFFPLAGDGATLAIEFDHRDRWEPVREHSFGPDLVARLTAAAAAFRAAWEHGTHAELAALGPVDPVVQRALSIREGHEAPGERPALGPHTFELGWQLRIVFPCGARWLVTYWQEEDGRLVLTGAY